MTRTLTLLAGSVLLACVGCASPDGLDPDPAPPRLNVSPKGQLEAGAALVDLTPTQPVRVAGFKILNESQGVRDPITARALALRVAPVTAVLVAVDLIGLHHHQVEAIRARVRGLPNTDTILVAATHTHASPDTLGMWGLPPIVSGIDDDYVEQVVSGVAEAVELAIKALEPVTLRWGQGLAPEAGIVRNLRSDRVDRRLTAFAFDRLDGGAPVATLIQFAAHPEVLGPDNAMLSADYPSALRTTVEAGRGGGLAVFVNGAIGALVTTAEDGHTGDEVERIGSTLGEVALRALETSTPLETSAIDLSCSRRPIRMPVENWRFHVGDTFGIFGGRPFEDGYTSSEIMAIRLGPAVFVTVPGEVEPRLGAELLAAVSSEPRLIVGLGNDELGYLIHEDEWADERYEYERTMSPGPLAATLVRRTVAAALRDVGAIRAKEDPMTRTPWTLLLVALCATAHADPEPTWGERLGFPADKRVVIFHADDVGMCHEANASVQETLPKGWIQSAAVMVPCPWFDEFAAWAKARPELDVGLHLTLTSEWKHYRWTPILPQAQVPGLYDADGFLPRTVLEVVLKSDAKQVEAEIRAQVERSLARGLKPGHLDTHMGTLYGHGSFTEAYLKVAQEYGIPAMVIEMTPKRVEQFRKQGYPLTPRLLEAVEAYPGPKLDNFLALEHGDSYEQVREKLFAMVRGLEPGITEIIFHPSVKTECLKAITNRWEQRTWEHRLFADPEVQAFLKAEGLVFTNWKELARRHAKAAGETKPAGPRKVF